MSRRKVAIAVIGWSMAAPLFWVAARPPLTGPVSVEVDEPVAPVTVARGPGSGDYFTGFEPEEGFLPRDLNFPVSGFSGWLNGQPWSADPLLNWRAVVICPANPGPPVEGHIDDSNPFNGVHHLRMSYQFTNKICAFDGVSCSLPSALNYVERPTSPYVVSCKVAISNMFGSGYRIATRSLSQGLVSAEVSFLSDSGIYVWDKLSDDTLPSYVYTGASWDISGAYQTLTIDFDPCSNHISYYYGGELIYTSIGGTFAGTRPEQLYIFDFRVPGSHLDLDDISLTRGEPCQFLCGNDFTEPVAGEECDGVDDDACPGLCLPDCTCCVRQCENRECGNDGCGGVCGECDNGIVCDGIETCDELSGQCQSGAPLVCSDGNTCNGTEYCYAMDGCRPGIPLVCSDGNSCNGTEFCDPASGCQSGTPPNCDDGLFCNGLEFCQSTVGCTPGNPPCGENEICDELTHECRQPTIPVASAWGLTVLAIVLLIGGKIHFSRKPFEPM